MAHQTFREQLQNSDLVLGTWVGSTDPMVVEAIASSRFEFLILDAEHGSLDRGSLLMNLISARAGGARTLVRLGGDDPVQYMHALDNGADGVIVPRVRNVTDVEQAVAMCRYPPLGRRGFGPRYAGGYYRNEREYVAAANDLVVVLVQIETKDAIENLEEILNVPGLDGVLVGRNDLAAELGLPRDHHDPELLAVTERVLSAARERGLTRAIAAEIDPEAPGELMKLGANVVAAGGDLEFIVNGVDTFIRRVEALAPATRAD